MNKEDLIHKYKPKTYKEIFLEYTASSTYWIYLWEKDKVRNEYDMKFNETMNGAQLLENKDKEKYLKNNELKIVEFMY